MQKTGTKFFGQLLGLAAVSFLTTLPATLHTQNQTNVAPAKSIAATHTLSRVYNLARGWGQSRMTPDYAGYSAMATFPPSMPMLNSSSANDYVASISQDGTYTWPADKLPIKVFVSSGQNVPGFRPQWRSYVSNCFDQWCQASDDRLSWVEAPDAAHADITIGWTNQVTERPEGTEAGKTSALTRLNTQTHKGIIYGAKMQLLTRLPNREFSDNEVFKTILHETGHALGLQGHSPTRTDIMYYAVNPNQQPLLSDRDKNTMAHLYAGYPTQDAVALGHRVPNQ